MRGDSRKLKGFTLIELLIVVAIIAILAAIAVPNFLEAQTRSKVARVKSDMRTISTAIESYMIDSNGKPPHLAAAVGHGQFSRNGINLCTNLSTPVAYLSSVNLLDPFCRDRNYDSELRISNSGTNASEMNLYAGICYVNIRGRAEAWGGGDTPQPTWLNHWAKYVLLSLGPDYIKGPDARTGAHNWSIGDYANPNVGRPYNKFATWDYDPTNGTASAGDILRWSN